MSNQNTDQSRASANNLNAGQSRSRASSIHSNSSSHGFTHSRSPIKPSAPSISNSQRLRNPSLSNGNNSSSIISVNNNTQGQKSQRRTSLTGLRDSAELSSSLGMPYSYPTPNVNSIKGSLNQHYSLNPNSHSRGGTDSSMFSRQPVSSRSSPRSSFSTDIGPDDTVTRRYSEQSHRKPSTEEVFDLMEREQDAIVLRLMREISKLKEDNRALLNTINQLTSGATSESNYSLRSASQSRSSLDSRRNSSILIDDSEISSLQGQNRSNGLTQKKDSKFDNLSTSTH